MTKKNNHHAIAIIPARGGSKRVPRKNIHPIAGRPMIAHVIAAAQASGLFQRVIVSSDDAEILSVSAEAGAEPYLRPAHLADDMTHVGPVVDDVVQNLRLEADSVCLLFATALLLQPRHLTEAFALLCQPEMRSVLAITEFDAPIQRAYEMHDDGSIQMALPEFFQWRSQDLPKRFRDAGMFSWMKNNGSGTKRCGYLIPKTESVDIDTPEDLLLAEALFAFQQRHRRG
jgi:pseudaminic acid cytidylyltransferase